MSLTQGFVKTFKSELSKSAVFTSIPLSILLVPLERLSDKHFSCPCKAELNVDASNLIFVAPFFFFFSLMCLALQPFKPIHQHGSNCSCSLNCKKCCSYCIFLKCKEFILCLIPPCVWIILLLLDGNYLACRDTDWNGVYVSEDEHHLKWCKPFKSIPGRNETELRDLTLRFVARSQKYGCVVLLVLSCIIILTVVISDCCCARCTSCSDEENVDQQLQILQNDNLYGTCM
ncbi:hypothetical protein PO909_008671 [Leuciscus waleckii]